MEMYRSHVLEIYVPQPLGYLIEKENARFIERHPGMRKAAATSYKVELPAQVLIAEKIPPLPEERRKTLIDLFCHEDLKQEALDNPKNKDCLIRVYLGKEDRREPSPKFLTLRNLCLYRNQFEHLQFHVLFCLDFNQVSRIIFDNTGTEAAADAFLENDPYCPRPPGESGCGGDLGFVCKGVSRHGRKDFGRCGPKGSRVATGLFGRSQ